MSDFPAINACLNALSAILLGVGYGFIRRKRRVAHRNCMVGAFLSSTVFLVGYVTYHTWKHYALGSGVTRFAGEGWIRPVYFTILLTHTILAMVIVPLVLVSLHRAIKGRFEEHRKIARWTLPLWMYVSVTGVVIYLLLYQLYPNR